MKSFLMEKDLMSPVISKARSCARSSPGNQSLQLSIEETGGPERMSVEESGSHYTSLPSDLYGFCDIHKRKVPPNLKKSEPQFSVPSKMTNDVDPQESPSQYLEIEEGPFKALSYEEEAKQGIVEDVPTQETHLFPAEIINDHKEKKKKRRRRRKSVEKTVEQFFYKSVLQLQVMLLAVLQFSPKMPSGLKVFGTRNLFEVVSGVFLNLFRGRALGWAGRVAFILFLLNFQSTSGLKMCQHMFTGTTAIDCPITLLNLKSPSQSVCNLKELARCPERTDCTHSISLCLWNDYSMMIYYLEKDTGPYSLEHGVITDGAETFNLGNEDCKEYSTNPAQTSRKDPPHVTTKTDPTPLPGDETSTVDPGIIAGIAAVIFLAAVCSITWWWRCRRRSPRKKKSTKCSPTPYSSGNSAGSSTDSVV
ncbi:uncharacterized protein [Pleurodeles waltl]|uniref:uncharacterized protein isoform X2 n=1 Tax=Pleurodeles waltl TaxID=8319 RepID=UPI0037093A3D